ncbi:MBL fold metallo-hydrolase [Mycobacterium sp. B14F4]|uniref:MBL fold metallo-hydrolase n=1 Tax=Mycobacterium sp. B14F4 TaxID=3153565 RepID=UPI00325CF3C4
MKLPWERLADRISRTRLPFLDVTVGLIVGQTGIALIDTGSTLTEAGAIRDDVLTLTGRRVTHILLTHNHFDHILGFPAFDGAAVYCAPAVAATVARGAGDLRADAIRHGADPDEIDRAVDALRRPDHHVSSAVIDLGDGSVWLSHPGRGHTDHDLIAVSAGDDRTVVFCGDLVEESADPCIGDDSDVAAWPSTLDRVLAAGGANAAYVPGHGAVVDAAFVRRQRRWLADRVTGPTRSM